MGTKDYRFPAERSNNIDHGQHPLVETATPKGGASGVIKGGQRFGVTRFAQRDHIKFQRTTVHQAPQIIGGKPRQIDGEQQAPRGWAVTQRGDESTDRSTVGFCVTDDLLWIE
jgi:hypothetical protein